MTPFLYVSGAIGSGKTTFARQVYERYLAVLADATDPDLIDPDIPTGTWIPVFVDLNNWYGESGEVVADLLLSRLSLYGDIFVYHYALPAGQAWRRRLFDGQDNRFLVIFDGIDELEDSDSRPWNQSLASIRSFVEARSGRIRAVLTGRTDSLPNALLRNRTNLQLLPLDRTQVVDAATIFLDSPSYFLNTVRRDPNIERLLTNPLILETVLKYAAETTPFSKQEGSVYDIGDIMHRVVTAIFQHESGKDPARNREETRIRRQSSLAKLAWKLDGRSNRATFAEIEGILDVVDISRVRQMGLLDLVPGDYYEFSSIPLKAYFAARYALQIVHKLNAGGDGVDWEIELRHATPFPGFWVLCESFFTGMIASENLDAARPFYRFVQSCTLNSNHAPRNRADTNT